MKTETDRLCIRPFTAQDIPALLQILSDEQANTFLPWFPLKTQTQAQAFLQEKERAAAKGGQFLAICQKNDDIPIGYLSLSPDDSHDFGYGLRSEFWHQGIVTEASRAFLNEIHRDIPYMTATHDVKNPRSGAVMQKLGMRYCYSYQEQWQPKNILVTFRMYQLNFDGQIDRVYQKYWDTYPHFIEAL